MQAIKMLLNPTQFKRSINDAKNAGDNDRATDSAFHNLAIAEDEGDEMSDVKIPSRPPSMRPPEWLTAEQKLALQKEDGAIAGLACISAAYILIDRCRSADERWSLARSLATLIAHKLHPGARLDKSVATGMGLLAWETLKIALAERDLMIEPNGPFYVVRKRGAPPSNENPPITVR